MVTLDLKSEILEIAFSDNGPGIPPEILPSLSRKGVTLKKSGTGLGLFHARQICGRAGGKFDLLSRLGQGTTVELKIPRASLPLWFMDHLEIPAGTELVVIDDEKTNRFWADVFGEQEFEHLFSGDDPRLTKLVNASNHFFLVGQQLLSGSQSGLEVIRERGIGNRSLLVTDRFDHLAIQEEAISMGVRIIPTQILRIPGAIRLKGEYQPQKIDFALIDNDPLIRTTWQMVASGKGLQVLFFEDVASFLEAHLPQDTTVFLDQHLGEDEFGNEILGEEQAKVLWDSGYQKIHLATGDLMIEKFPRYAVSVRDKSFPVRTEYA